MSPIVSRLERQGYPVRKVDVDQERSLAERYNVTKMPTFILVVDGKERTRVVGMTSEGQLKRLLAQIPHDPKPSVIRNPDPRSVAGANASRNVRVAVNEEPPTKTPARNMPSFVFPFGEKTSAQNDPPNQPPVIRAKLDQEEKRPPVSVEENPLASSVRVRITNQAGANYGSGTMIDSRPGRTVILTCGHIFRDLEPNAKIEIDVFTGTETETFVGKTLGYDLEGDVGLLTIATNSPLPASPLAGTSQEVRARQGVYSIGCGGGEHPSREDLYVTALNRYLGPDNIECTGEPLQGRSGGGLFNAEGKVVGVCVAADHRDKRGLYAGLPVIHKVLKEQNLTALIPADSLPSSPAIANAAAETSAASAASRVAPPVKTAVAKGGELGLPAGLKHPGEAEVICIVRPLNQPKSASRVVIINRASSRFVSYLTQEIKDQPQPTMHQTRLESKPTELEAPPFAQAETIKAETIEAPPFATSETKVSQAAQTLQRYRRRR